MEKEKNIWKGNTGKNWKKYRIALQIRERIMGGKPKNPKVIRDWLKAKVDKGELKASKEDVERLAIETETMVEETEERSWTGFLQDEHGLFIHAYQIKAMLKEAAKVLGFNNTQRGLKQTFQHGTEIKPVGWKAPEPDRIHLNAKTPDGVEEHVTHTRFGSALKRMDYVEMPKIVFELWTLKTGKLTQGVLCDILEHAQESGLGASRAMGFGKFDVVEIVKLTEDEVDEPEQ